MIPLDAQVCPLAAARTLCALGVPQVSLYGWYADPQGRPRLRHRATVRRAVLDAAAFTVSELLALLGPRFKVLQQCDDGQFEAWGAAAGHARRAAGTSVPAVLAALLEEVTTQSNGQEAHHVDA
jgi:hypothetical protein